MKTLGRNLSLFGLSAALAFGLEGSSTNQAITAADKHEIEESFEDIEGYWTQQEVGLDSVKLAFSHGTDFAAEYRSKSDEVAISKGFIDWVGSVATLPDEKVAALRFVIAHEIAHAIQDDTGQLVDNTLASGRKTRSELQADCLAGVALQTLFPEDVDLAAKFVNTFGFDMIHGIGSEREAYFLKGSETGDCPF